MPNTKAIIFHSKPQPCKIDAPTRLRRAIHLSNPVLVNRLIRNHPTLITNPDFSNKSNTSLHLAASLGSLEIVSLLLSAGHEIHSGETSRNALHETPLMLAARNGHVEVGELLVSRQPSCVALVNREGLDALAICAQTPSSVSLMPVLLQHGASPHGRDYEGNTPLHHASASGSLKALRLLLSVGANPLAKNLSDWTPLAYSQTVAAEVYFKNLVAEFERRKVEGKRAEGEKERARVGGVRLVEEKEVEEFGGGGGGGRGKQSLDEGEFGRNDGRGWSPVAERKRAGT